MNMVAGLRTEATHYCSFSNPHYHRVFNVIASNLKGQVKFKRDIGYLGQENESKSTEVGINRMFKIIIIIFIGMRNVKCNRH